MMPSKTVFPRHSRAYSEEESAGTLINGMRVVFSKRAAAYPVETDLIDNQGGRSREDSNRG